jgi:hypothetical protein
MRLVLLIRKENAMATEDLSGKSSDQLRATAAAAKEGANYDGNEPGERAKEGSAFEAATEELKRRGEE